ncbi:hypothetical protein [Streptomyces sp. NPDC004728]|uniref:hypothetical protein n=1 Tax=Streptomyces sp. NPDC004728 TaxID=3154289 RepID=UPI0033BABFB1
MAAAAPGGDRRPHLYGLVHTPEHRRSPFGVHDHAVILLKAQLGSALLGLALILALWMYGPAWQSMCENVTYRHIAGDRREECIMIAKLLRKLSFTHNYGAYGVHDWTTSADKA